jgi:hypothetical protein
MSKHLYPGRNPSLTHSRCCRYFGSVNCKGTVVIPAFEGRCTLAIGTSRAGANPCYLFGHVVFPRFQGLDLAECSGWVRQNLRAMPFGLKRPRLANFID